MNQNVYFDVSTYNRFGPFGAGLIIGVIGVKSEKRIPSSQLARGETSVCAHLFVRFVHCSTALRLCAELSGSTKQAWHISTALQKSWVPFENQNTEGFWSPF